MGRGSSAPAARRTQHGERRQPAAASPDRGRVGSSGQRAAHLCRGLAGSLPWVQLGGPPGAALPLAPASGPPQAWGKPSLLRGEKGSFARAGAAETLPLQPYRSDVPSGSGGIPSTPQPRCNSQMPLQPPRAAAPLAPASPPALSCSGALGRARGASCSAQGELPRAGESRGAAPAGPSPPPHSPETPLCRVPATPHPAGHRHHPCSVPAGLQLLPTVPAPGGAV